MLSLLIPFLLFSKYAVEASNTCQPVTWVKAARRDVASITSVFSNGTATTSTSTSATAIYTPGLFQDTSLLTTEPPAAGEINCRATSFTTDLVNYYTCTRLANAYEISIEQFFLLNPSLNKDCSNIQINTVYCTSGYIEPVVATDGKCGPLYNNATCIGSGDETTYMQCCNSQTWTCGNSTSDCAAGTCYEGACAGDDVYSTDGTCGYLFGNRLCAGIWGDCCSSDGKCGTGSAFCDGDACQSGNCSWAGIMQPATPIGLVGNTTDGTCGSASGFTCSESYGECCNKNNVCGSLPSDCGLSFGCQPLYGNCSTAATIPSTTTSTISTTSATSSFTGLPSCAQSCLKNSMAQYSSFGCTTPDPSCLCNNFVFRFDLRSCPTTTGCTADEIDIANNWVIAWCATASSTRAAGQTTSTSTTSSIATTSSKTSTSSITTTSSTTTSVTSLPSCGTTCFNALIAQYSSLGCSTPDPYCLCSNVNFGYGIRDCSNAICTTDEIVSVNAHESAYCASASSTAKATMTATATATGIAALPSCGTTCFNALIAQYSDLGCSTPDPYCLCNNVNFGYGIRDCSNAVCSSSDVTSVQAYEVSYCSSASSTAQATATGIAALPACGQTCFTNVIAQYSALGCATPDPSCLCGNVNFGYGIRDCSNGACGTAVASTVIAYESVYCAAATKTAAARLR